MLTANSIDESKVDPEFLRLLVCPRDHKQLEQDGNSLVCKDGHRYGVVEGVPILLVAETEQTHCAGVRSLQSVDAGSVVRLVPLKAAEDDIDPFVQRYIGGTNGSFYVHLIDKLKEYPIPNLRLPDGDGKRFLEIGCCWGRWCIAAARRGYRAIGIDPSLEGILAARRVAQQLRVNAQFLVADGRCLPFAEGFADQVFSYSVLQHLSRENVVLTLREVHRVLRERGHAEIQMAGKFGVRSFYHQVRRGFRETEYFEVRYWTPDELRSVFSDAIGPTRISVDGFFSLNPQISDLRFFPRRYRALVRLSEFLRKASKVVPALKYVADSVYVSSVREP
jgi:ubiquinone/menaquinone biosynthesis C-methylase UbiE/uncharacterized protein YbaR (Trm112 family)